MEEAEAEVHRLEARMEEVKHALADPALYEAGGTPDEAVERKRELASLEDDLAEAMERWTAAGEALEG